MPKSKFLDSRFSKSEPVSERHRMKLRPSSERRYVLVVIKLRTLRILRAHSI